MSSDALLHGVLLELFLLTLVTQRKILSVGNFCPCKGWLEVKCAFRIRVILFYNTSFQNKVLRSLLGFLGSLYSKMMTKFLNHVILKEQFMRDKKTEMEGKE